jgi:hypothetical protein
MRMATAEERLPPSERRGEERRAVNRRGVRTGQKQHSLARGDQKAARFCEQGTRSQAGSTDEGFET